MKKLFYFIVMAACVAILVIGANILINKNPDIRRDVDGIINKIAAVFDDEEANKTAIKPTVQIYGPYQVIRVIDGDTLLIDVDGAQTRVRLIGIDTPESVNPDNSKNSPEGKIASNFTKAIIEDQSYVFLGYDVQRKDDYNRTLAYIFLDRGKTMLQERLLEAGMARTMTIQPNSLFANYFYAIMVKAREEKAGFWASDFWGDAE